MDKTFVKGLAVLELLAHAENEKGVSEIAREMGLTKSNVHRLLTTLQGLGYVTQVPRNNAYELTSKLWELGARVHSRLDVTKVARGPMSDLESATGETVHLSILDGWEVVYVGKLDGTHPIKAYTTIGGRAPAWCVATGKALLAHSATSRVDQIAARLARFTERTIVDREALLAELETIRHEGYAVNQGEWRDGVSGIAAPVYSADGSVTAAIGISGPSARFRQKDLKARWPLVVEAAAAVSKAMGYHAEIPPARPVTHSR